MGWLANLCAQKPWPLFCGLSFKEEKHVVEVAQGISKLSADRVSQKEEKAAPTSTLLLRSPQTLQRHKQTRKQFPLLLPNTPRPAARVLQIKPN